MQVDCSTLPKVEQQNPPAAPDPNHSAVGLRLNRMVMCSTIAELFPATPCDFSCVHKLLANCGLNFRAKAAPFSAGVCLYKPVYATIARKKAHPANWRC